MPATYKIRPELWTKQPDPDTDGLFAVVESESADGPVHCVCEGLYEAEAALKLAEQTAIEQLDHLHSPLDSKIPDYWTTRRDRLGVVIAEATQGSTD